MAFVVCKNLFEKFSLVSFLKPTIKSKERSVVDEGEKNKSCSSSHIGKFHNK